MSGKAYTMREMKAIVDYVTERRAYGEIRGRKMWMNYADSKQTTRTWQSLKETFLKRILPDITNPYYKLTVQEIANFQQGTDLEARINNRLEIQTIHGDSSSDTDKKDHLTLNTKNSKGGENARAGEDKCSNINKNRSSTETVVIEPCYNDAQEIQNVLESPTKECEKENPIPCSTKSIRDYITYSEPLTPMLQEVLHDFVSDDEADEPQMQIVEYPEPATRKETSSQVEKIESENNYRVENNGDVDNDANNGNRKNEDSTAHKINESNLTDSIDKSDDVQIIEDSEEVVERTTNKNAITTETTASAVSQNENEKNNLSKSQNSTSETLPNNQEALKELSEITENVTEEVLNNLSVNNDVDDSRKRPKSKETSPHGSPEKRICSNEILEQNSIDRETKADDKQNNTKVDSKISNTQVKGQVNADENHNIQNPVNASVVSDVNKEKVDESANKINESVCISDDNLSDQQNPQDVVIKTNEDKATSMSEDPESRDTIRNLKKSTNQSESSGFNRYVTKDVLVLQSHSESTSDLINVSSKKSKDSLRAANKKDRDRVLANVLGFSTGPTLNRKKQQNMKRLSTRKRVINSSSSEDWTSDTATEYISPPRGRKNKLAKKYLKPKSARVLSLEEEGGLFVMYGKKIYPVVKDGKVMKNYVTYSPNNDSEDEESYWKLKYVEEKRKTEELTKLLKRTKKQENEPVVSKEIPVPQEDNCQKPAPIVEPPKEIVEKNVEPGVKVAEKKEQPTETKTVKIQFMKDNETVQVEGHWSQIQPVLEQVVHILHKDPEPREKAPKKRSIEGGASPARAAPAPARAAPAPAPHSPAKKPKLSRESTPASTIQLDDDVNEKLDKIEEEIFQKIQERDLAENTREDSSDIHVTKRKAVKPKLSSLSVNKLANVSVPGKKSFLRPPDEVADTSVATRPSTRTPEKDDKEMIEKEESESKRITRRSSRTNVSEDDASVKYKFPSPPRQHKNKRARKTGTKQTAKRKLPSKTAKIFSSPDNISLNSIESSQGYQDSDESNISICLRKKRKLSLTVLSRGRAKSQRFFKRKLQQHEDISSDSNVSFVTAPLKSSSQQSSSLNTEVYRSESYQLLFPKKQNSIRHLEVIEEKSPTADNINCLNNDDAVSDALTEKSTLAIHESNSLSPAFVKYAESSHNMTVPPSPVLSIIEKISVNKTELANTKDIDIPTETHEEAKPTMLNDYMLEDIDMSVPLMEQECGLKENRSNEMECNYNLNIPETSSQLSDTLLNKVCAVNISEPTLSESIHQKLKNLLLESAKKLAKRMNEKNDKDKESEMEICEPEKPRKTKAKKRCSTPRKRQSKKNSKDTNIELQIEEERIESCVNEKSRQPPMLIVTDAVENNNNIVTTDIDEGKSSRLRKKKDVIKVKISKPKTKKKEYSSEDMQKGGKVLQADSGINDMESGVFLRELDDSLDLIHNHSDTCLRGHDCISDSLEIVDDNAISIISVNSNSVPIKKIKSASLTLTTEHLSDICCENAQDSTNLYTATDIRQDNSSENSCIFKSPIANISSVNSLLTDDLSDEIPAQNSAYNRLSKWYLLSEDETSNTNNIDLNSNIPKSISGCGANLQEIFPITCAVPDLSTITEENTAKFNIDGNTGSQFNSPSLSNI